MIFVKIKSIELCSFNFCALWCGQLKSPPLLPAGVKLDPSKAWCPVVECQAVCSMKASTEGEPTAVPCTACNTIFCSGCRGPWQDGHTCPERQPMMSSSPSHENRSVSHHMAVIYSQHGRAAREASVAVWDTVCCWETDTCYRSKHSGNCVVMVLLCFIYSSLYPSGV